MFQTISGFTNAAGTGDKLDLINNVTIAGNAGAAATGVTNLSGAITSGIITFSGTAAAGATLNKIDAAASLAGTTQYNAIGFEHGGNTYVFEQGDATASYAAGVDVIVQLTGVTRRDSIVFWGLRGRRIVSWRRPGPRSGAGTSGPAPVAQHPGVAVHIHAVAGIGPRRAVQPAVYVVGVAQ